MSVKFVVAKKKTNGKNIRRKLLIIVERHSDRSAGGKGEKE